MRGQRLTAAVTQKVGQGRDCRGRCGGGDRRCRWDRGWHGQCCGGCRLHGWQGRRRCGLNGCRDCDSAAITGTRTVPALAGEHRRGDVERLEVVALIPFRGRGKDTHRAALGVTPKGTACHRRVDHIIGLAVPVDIGQLDKAGPLHKLLRTRVRTARNLIHRSRDCARQAIGIADCGCGAAASKLIAVNDQQPTAALPGLCNHLRRGDGIGLRAVVSTDEQVLFIGRQLPGGRIAQIGLIGRNRTPRLAPQLPVHGADVKTEIVKGRLDLPPFLRRWDARCGIAARGCCFAFVVFGSGANDTAENGARDEIARIRSGPLRWQNRQGHCQHCGGK
mmetsp:Transcript_22912/g.38466  ORF Transcript_22912/g.38466 Transcript_22912/m.38466 type:complete len:334 (+) Transcript_22912:1307-2308(+)